jgi:hypothetical protein
LPDSQSILVRTVFKDKIGGDWAKLFGYLPARLSNPRKIGIQKLYAERLHSIDEICEMIGVSKPILYKKVLEYNDAGVAR